MATATNIQATTSTIQTVPNVSASLVVLPCDNVEAKWKTVARRLPEVVIATNERLPYLLEIRQAISKGQPDLALADLQLACHLAEYLADGILLNQLIEKCLDVTHYDNKDYLALKIKFSLSLAKMGMFERALSVLELELLAHPFDNNLLYAASVIQTQWQETPYTLADCRSDKLMLLPLTQDYLNDFCWQYTDSISDLCNLPKFTSNDEWLNWLTNDNRPKEQKLFAVLHKDWGFIGSVSIEVFQGIGFFYYWLGTDFQRLGYGPEAVNILLHLAEKHITMDCCYAKVYQHNQASHKAMAKLGFNALTMKAKPPCDNEIFYYKGPEKSHWNNYQELEWLLKMQYSTAELEGPEGCLYTLNKGGFG
jgi:RimJ/RimL family protein N-acetyltransferase